MRKKEGKGLKVREETRKGVKRGVRKWRIGGRSSKRGKKGRLREYEVKGRGRSKGKEGRGQVTRRGVS